MKLLIKNGIVNSPANGIENKKMDILIEKGKISKIALSISENCRSIDATNLHVFPGLVDMHVHLREPGYENKETIESGSMAAAAGGFTSIACMANTKPPIDTSAQIKYILSTAAKHAKVNVFPYGAVTRELKGELITEMGDMLENGAVAFSDDGSNIANAGTMMRALEYTKTYNKPIVVHAEDYDLSANGTIHSGFFAERKGLHGIPAEAEEVIIGRDIMLCRLTGAKVHFTHVSSKGGIALIKAAKKEGLNVTCDITPHHISLTCDDVGDYNPNMKMKPPLREKSDIKELKKAALNGTVDAIATDHAPHTAFEKSLEFGIVPFGIIGLETAIPIVLEYLFNYNEKHYPLLASLMSTNPSQILGINKGTLSKDADADITIINTKEEFVYTEDIIVSKSSNSPYIGRKLMGKAVCTIVNGSVVYKA